MDEKQSNKVTSTAKPHTHTLCDKREEKFILILKKKIKSQNQKNSSHYSRKTLSYFSPLGLLGKYVTPEVLGKADAQNLDEGQSYEHSGHGYEVVIHPDFSLVDAAGSVDDVAGILLLSSIIATLPVLNDVVGIGLATGEWNATSLPTGGGAVEINIQIPVFEALHSTALQPIFLDPVDEVLKIGVISVLDDHSLQLRFDLLLDPVLIDEDDDADSQLAEEYYAHGYAVDEQQKGVFPECPDAPREPDDEDEQSGNYEDEGRVERNLGKLAQILEHVLLGPSPEAHGQHHAPQQPEDNIESKYQILYDRTNFRSVSSGPCCHY